MAAKTVLVELLLSGFFAVACLRAHEPGGLFQMPPRLERLRRSRWQWFAMVAFTLVLRLQDQLPLAVELMVAVQFALFFALPARAKAVV